MTIGTPVQQVVVFSTNGMVPKKAKETLEVVGAFLLFTVVQEARQKPIIAKSIYWLESKYFIIL